MFSFILRARLLVICVVVAFLTYVSASPTQPNTPNACSTVEYSLTYKCCIAVNGHLVSNGTSSACHAPLTDFGACIDTEYAANRSIPRWDNDALVTCSFISDSAAAPATSPAGALAGLAASFFILALTVGVF
jgi:hypothetical protein